MTPRAATPGMAGWLWLALSACGAAAATPSDPFAPSSTGIAQIREIMAKLSRTMGDIPPDVDRIAVYQIKTDPREFTPGMSRYIQGQLEDTFRKEGRKTVVTSPELRTYRVVANDSSFRFTNSVASMEELWKLGEKLRADGFIEGSCSKTSDRDVILNLKLFRHKTGEVVWSGSFVAGPNDKPPAIFDLDWSASGSLRWFPIKEALIPVDVITDTNHLEDTIPDMTMTGYSFEGSVSEAVVPGKWLIFTVSAGYILGSGRGIQDSLDINFNVHLMKFGIEILGVFFRKSNPDLGYWLGTYAGYQEFIPFLNKGHLTALTLGYKSRVSRHFTLGGGIMFVPFGRRITGLGVDEGRQLTFEPVAYELTYLHYTF